ncbi:hypothetical protein ACAY42_001054 [Citrobacter freundii]|nr:hypothetical protein CUC51_01845 [Citrobacter freundii]POU47423.1 hypothetical protein C3375_03415 [Citrobacter freundii complex sp. CFNIH12]EKA7904988.1 hypothetical protein [Citrobacter freundii]EKV5430031.1 hypothetical protein [Citrobacter freundii]EKY1515107.1 hypothetical protein [Citrobacter freundii]
MELTVSSTEPTVSPKSSHAFLLTASVRSGALSCTATGLLASRGRQRIILSAINAVNFLVEKYELVRIDPTGFTSHEQAPYLTVIDILHARKSCGLMNSCSYREVSNIVLSRSRL